MRCSLRSGQARARAPAFHAKRGAATLVVESPAASGPTSSRAASRTVPGSDPHARDAGSPHLACARPAQSFGHDAQEIGNRPGDRRRRRRDRAAVRHQLDARTAGLGGVHPFRRLRRAGLRDPLDRRCPRARRTSPRSESPRTATRAVRSTPRSWSGSGATCRWRHDGHPSRPHWCAGDRLGVHGDRLLDPADRAHRAPCPADAAGPPAILEDRPCIYCKSATRAAK